MEPHDAVIYWDASAILSALFTDRHSDEAQAWAHRAGLHLMSTLAYAETCAVIARLHRQRLAAEVLSQAAQEVLDSGPWRRVTAWPAWNLLGSLAKQWSLRGADLWHLATAKTLLNELPELQLLTFDARLQLAAEGESLVGKLGAE
jgi:predicted nucleic acid-binding protein